MSSGAPPVPEGEIVPQQHHPKRDQCPCPVLGKGDLEKVGVWGHRDVWGPQTAWGHRTNRKGPRSPGRGWIRDAMEREGRLGFSGDGSAGGKKGCCAGEGGKGPA